MTLPGDPFEGQDWTDLSRSLRDLLGETVSGLAGVLGQERSQALVQAFLSLGNQLARRPADIPEREREAIRRLLARLAALPVLAPEEPLEVRVDGERWRRVDDLAGSGPQDPVFRLDPLSGTVRFGDGLQGARPADGAHVSVVFAEGGGAAGNPAAAEPQLEIPLPEASPRPGPSLALRFPWPPPQRSYRIELLPQGSLQLVPLPAGAAAGAGTASGPAAPSEDASPAASQRLNFFSGRLLSAADLQQEQAYHLGRRRLHNRAVHGEGVVEGLALRLGEDDAAPAVTVNRGLALDALGREVVLDDPLTLAIPSGPSPLLVLVAYSERPVHPVPVSGAGAPVPSRIEEGAVVRLVEAGSGSEGVVVGQLLRENDRWRIDPCFEPLRVRS